MNDSVGLPFSLAPPGGQAETAQVQRVVSGDGGAGGAGDPPPLERGLPLLETILAGDEDEVGQRPFPTLFEHK